MTDYLGKKELHPKKIDSKDIAAPSSGLGEVILELQDGLSGLDRVRGALALRMQQYNDIKLSDDQKSGLIKAFHDIETGSSTNLVLICSKQHCLYKERCPLYNSDNIPEGRECLHENYTLMHYMDKYLQSLEVDINNTPEMVLINQLVEYELIEYRCNVILSNSHQDLKWTRIVGLDKQGDIVESEEVSYAFLIKEKVQRLKFEILKSFTATRQEKYKKQAALKEAKEGPSKILSSIKSKIKAKKDAIVDAEEVANVLNSLHDEDLEV